MLYYETVTSKLLELLEGIQQNSLFQNLRLVGGTSLALQIGHRKSVDLDLFGELNVNDVDIRHALGSLGNLTLLNSTKNIHVFLLDNIKIDIVNYSYPWIENPKIVGNLKMAGLKDIAAMKLNAVCGRGTKKDFIDVYFLLKQFTLPQMLRFYQDKYSDGSTFLVLKSLTFFDDANSNEIPFMLKQVDWEIIKTTIRDAVKDLHN